MSATVPRECIDDQPGAMLGTDAGHSGVSPEPGDVVDDRRTGSRAAAATSALTVSTETGTPGQRARTALMIGRIRRRSSSAVTPAAPGPRRLAADVENVGAIGEQSLGLRQGRGGEKKLPPSLKLSGVTLMIPRTTGRSSGTVPPRTRQLIEPVARRPRSADHAGATSGPPNSGGARRGSAAGTATGGDRHRRAGGTARRPRR